MHTGTGRISKLLMRPMSLFETGESNGKVSLSDITLGKDIEGVPNLDFDSLINAMIRGGWPEALNISGDNKYRIAKDYINSLLSEGIKMVDGVERNSSKMSAVLKSIARNISTNTSKATIIDDVKNKFKDSCINFGIINDLYVIIN